MTTHTGRAGTWALMIALLVGCDDRKESGKAENPGARTETGGAKSPNPTLKGRWVPVVRENLSEYVPAVGFFQAVQSTRLGSQVSGRVKDVLVDVGTKVKKGDELVRLDPEFFDIEVAQRGADRDAAKTAADEAELNWKRMKELWEKPEGEEPSIPRRLYDDAKSRRDTAQARLRQAEEALRWSLERKKEATVRAPYDAVVTKRYVDSGEPVTATPVTHLLEIQDISSLELEFSLPQELLASVKEGETRVLFDVEGLAGGPDEATVVVVYPAIEESTRSFRCRALVPNSGHRFRPGLLVRVKVAIKTARETLVVPRSALRQTATGWEVTVSRAGKEERQPVQVGIVGEEKIEVLDGLKEGERVFVPEERQ